VNIFNRLPFRKKADQHVPYSWDEMDPEHYTVIHHVLYGYSSSTSVPHGYGEVFSEEEIRATLEKAREMVANLNLNVANAAALNRVVELKAARLFFDRILERHQSNLLSAYRMHSDVILQKDEMAAFIQLRECQLDEIQKQIDKLTKD
jgi:hypothetical protein